MTSNADRHERAVLTHEQAAKRHDQAARYWAEQGDAERCELERWGARLERDLVELERAKAKVERERPIRADRSGVESA